MRISQFLDLAKRLTGRKREDLLISRLPAGFTGRKREDLLISRLPKGFTGIERIF
jgi:hypothetical protein